uniref:LRRCT domain-containing protein n=1 Tax=Maylandia zebra TaxID=106582 RepID=A0A3P9DG51_9CICH
MNSKGRGLRRTLSLPCISLSLFPSTPPPPPPPPPPLLSWCLYYAAVMCLLLSPVRMDDACPSSCICTRGLRTVTCRDGDYTEVPRDMPKWTSTLTLTGSNISTLQRDAFMTNGTELEMTTLSLSYNGIQAIEPYAFLGLSRLHSLDLSHNQLEFISSRAFHGLPDLRSLNLNYSVSPAATAQLSDALNTQSLRNLHRLELAGNKLTSIPLERLDVFNLHERIRVYLSLNPFRCSCELEAFYYWLKNSSQCLDAGRLLCSEPEAKRGIPVEKLRGEEVDCMNENLEAVSYVFLGIVLALIGVVFLMLSALSFLYPSFLLFLVSSFFYILLTISDLLCTLAPPPFPALPIRSLRSSSFR